MEKDEDIQELKSKSGQLDSNKVRDILIVRLPDHMKDEFQRIGEALSNDQLLRVYLLLISRDMVFSKGDTDLGHFTAVKHHIDPGNSRHIKSVYDERLLPPTFTSGLYRCTVGMQEFH